MNLSTDSKILQDVRELIRDNLLPRIAQLEEEVRLLRGVTWPVCQSLRECTQLNEMEQKRTFLKILDKEEVQWLIQEKANISYRPLAWSSSHLPESF